MNYLMILALEKYHEYFGDEFKVEFPSHSGNLMNLRDVSEQLRRRLISIFTADNEGFRKVNGNNKLINKDSYFKDLIQFYEFFNGDTAKGVGASHQTGWTGCIAELINHCSW